MIGRTLKGRYKIYDQVGSGGFATVYLGRNAETNEIVAVKVLSQELTVDSEYVERFRREASMAEHLRHPNVVRVLDHGLQNGSHFLVMEYIEGLTLEQICLRRGPLPIEESVSYAEQVCAGLQAAHDQGIVHRDVKPGNVMITPAGTVKIMDFGIARADAYSGLTQSGVFMGTPRYVAPEIARGQRADIRSDIYSAGVLLYEMLAGTPPFVGDSPWAVLHQQMETEPTPLRILRADVPAWLDVVVARSLAKDPGQRFQTPEEMAAALRQGPTAPRPITGAMPAAAPVVPPAAAKPPPSPEREGGASKAVVLALVGAVVIVAGVLVVLLVLAFGGDSPSTPPVQTLVVAREEGTGAAEEPGTAAPVVVVVTNTPEDSQTPDPASVATSTLAEAQMTDVPTETAALMVSDTPTHESTEPPPVTDTPTPELTDTPLPTGTPEPSAQPTKAPTNTPQPTATPTSPPSVAVEGRIAFGAGGYLHIADAATGQDLVAPLAGLRQPDFRRDGNQIIADGIGHLETSLRAIDANTGGLLRQQSTFTDDYHPFWSPSGDRFVYDSLHHGFGNYHLLYTQVLDDRSPKPDLFVAFDGTRIRGTSPVWMEDDWLAFTGCDYWPDEQGNIGGSLCGIYRMPSWGGRPVRIVAGNTTMRATDSRGGQLLYMNSGGGDWEVYIMPAQGGAERNLSQSPASNDGLATFSPNGQHVAFASNREGVWAIWVVNLDGSGLTKLFDLPAPPTDPWSDEHVSWGP
jgi:serine/threonine-protein kinase